jgi:hypothetical protein
MVLALFAACSNETDNAETEFSDQVTVEDTQRLILQMEMNPLMLQLING